MEENKRSYPCDEEDTKTAKTDRTYPCDEEDTKTAKSGRVYPCDEKSVNESSNYENADGGKALGESGLKKERNYPFEETNESGGENTENAAAGAPKGKGKRGGNSGFSVVKHSGNFKERPQREKPEHGFKRDGGYEKNRYEDKPEHGFGRNDGSESDRYEDRGRRFDDSRSFDSRGDRRGKPEHGFGSRVHSENFSDRRSETSAYGDRKSPRADKSGRNFGDSRDNRDSHDNRDSRGGRDNRGSRDRRDNRDSRDGYSKKIVNEQDFSDPFNLKIIEVNEYGAFVELPAGALTKKISGITVSGNYLSDENGTQSQRVLVPFAEQIGRPGRGETVRVRFYADKSGRMTATMREPILNDGEVGILKVADVTRIGIFLDNGVPKQVLLPFREQIEKPEVGDEVLVYLYRDKSQRQAATMRVYKHLEKFGPYKEDDKVTGFVYEINEDLGVFVAVDNKYYGMIPIHETFKQYSYGDKIEARVSRVREDGKMDLLVRDKLYLSVETDADAILYELKRNNGFLPYGDRADADFIEETYAMSKNQFKRALGHLFKNHKVELDREKDTVKLIED